MSAKTFHRQFISERKKKLPFLTTQISYLPTRSISYVAEWLRCAETRHRYTSQTVRRSFLTSAFVIKLSWGSERYVEQEKLATKLPRALCQSSLRKPQRGKEVGTKDENQVRDGMEERKRKRRCIPTQIQGTRKLGSSISSRNEESSDARTNACPLVVYLWYLFREYTRYSNLRIFFIYTVQTISHVSHYSARDGKTLNRISRKAGD